ncbi:MAG TPA: hypothetical protein VF373_07565, partial [Prolixibacteraceae bacterium]
MRNLLFALILSIVAYSCTKEYDLQLKTTQSKLVVEGTITNQNGPYLVRLTKSRLELHFEQNRSSDSDTSYNYQAPNDGVVAIQDAEVYITDKNTSFTDTLVKCPVGTWHYFEAGNNYPAWSYFEVEDTSIVWGH